MQQEGDPQVPEAALPETSVVDALREFLPDFNGPSRFFDQLNGRVCTLVRDDEHSLLSQMVKHKGKPKKEKKAKKGSETAAATERGSRSKVAQMFSAKERVESTAFVVDILTSLKNIFGVQNQLPANYKKEQSVDEKNESMRLIAFYNALTALKFILEGQRNTLVTQSQAGAELVIDVKIATSKFLNFLLNALNTVLNLGNAALVKKNAKGLINKAKEEDKQIALRMLDAVIVGANDYLDVCRAELDSRIAAKIISSPVQRSMEYYQSDALLGLFQYCADKEGDKRSNAAKRDLIYNILMRYLTASSPQDFVDLFNLIVEGIKLSRKEGRDGEESRLAEKMLVKFRDGLVDVIFLNDHANGFSTYPVELITQKILNSISVVGATMSNDVLLIVDRLEAAGELHEDMNKLRVGILQRLITEIPNDINGIEMTFARKAQYCREKGLVWAQTIARLLEDPTLDPELRRRTAALGYIWNNMMEEVQEPNSAYFTPQHYVGFDVIAAHELIDLFPDLQKVLGRFCKEEHVARVQSMLAGYHQQQLVVPDEGYDVPEYADHTIDIVEQLIAQNDQANLVKALGHIKKQVLEIPDSIAGNPVNKTQHCIAAGFRWARAMNALLLSPELTDAQRAEVGVCASLWNYYVDQGNVTDVKLLTLQHLVGLETVKNHELVSGKAFAAFRKSLKDLCETNLSRVHGKLAAGYQAKLAAEHETLHEEEFAALRAIGRESSVVSEQSRDDAQRDDAQIFVAALQGNRSPLMLHPTASAVATVAETSVQRLRDDVSSSSGDEPESASDNEAATQKASSPRMGRGSGSGDNN